MSFYAETIFPWFLDRSLDTPEICDRRKRLVEDARGDVLEIGFGTGATLPFYNREMVRSLSVVEPSTGMNKRAKAMIARLNWPITIDALTGEDLPFEDECFLRVCWPKSGESCGLAGHSASSNMSPVKMPNDANGRIASTRCSELSE
jgi:SAM-dependent methyltransferase